MAGSRDAYVYEMAGYDVEDGCRTGDGRKEGSCKGDDIENGCRGKDIEDGCRGESISNSCRGEGIADECKGYDIADDCNEVEIEILIIHIFVL